MRENLLKVWPKILKADRAFCRGNKKCVPLSDWFEEWVKVNINVAPMMSYKKFVRFVLAMPKEDPWKKSLIRALDLESDKHG